MENDSTHSASQAVLISEPIARELNTNIVNSDMILATAQGADILVKGQVNLNLEITGHKFEVKTQVINHLSPHYDIILGIGFLNQHRTSLNIQPGHTPVFLY